MTKEKMTHFDDLADFMVTNGDEQEAINFLNQIKEQAEAIVEQANNEEDLEKKKALLLESLDLFPFQISTYLMLIDLEENNFKRLEIIMNGLNEIGVMMQLEEANPSDMEVFDQMKEDYLELMSHYFFTLVECGIYLEAAHAGKNLVQLDETRNTEIAQLLVFLYVGIEWYQELDAFIASQKGYRNCYYDVAVLMKHLKLDQKAYADAVMQRIDQEFPAFRDAVLDLDNDDQQDDFRMMGFLLSNFGLYEILEGYLSDSHPQLA